MNVSKQVYSILVSRRHRSGPLDFSKEAKLVERINKYVVLNEPIQLFHFWGGSKNPNLPIKTVDLCEEKSLDHLNQINLEIKKVYAPSLKITICPGDGRVEFCNSIPAKDAENYSKGLAHLADAEKYNSLFKIVRVSELYSKKSGFSKIRKEIFNEVMDSIELIDCWKDLFSDATNNIKGGLSNSPEKIKQAAAGYVASMVSEERLKVYEEYDEYIRSFFMRFNNKYFPIYKKYLSNQKDLFLSSPYSLYFFSGSKGNVTQPWQAFAKNCDGKVVFASQKKS